MKCADCPEDTLPYGRFCEKHERNIVPKRDAKFGNDRAKVAGRKFPGGLQSVRTLLVESLASVIGDTHADNIVNALDDYLEVDPAERVPAFRFLPPNPQTELDKSLKERDDAIARAEKAERALQAVSKKKPRIKS
jgi:hypothetical protein